MTSTESQPEVNQADEADRDALRDALETGEGVKRLTRMAGMRSIHRNLKAEDEMLRRNWAAMDKEMGVDVSEPDKEDAMDIMAARDVIVYQGGGSDRWPPTDPRGTQPTPPAPTPTPTPAPVVATSPQPAVQPPPRVEQPRTPIVQPVRPKPVAVAPAPPAEESSKYPAWLGPALLGAGLIGGAGLGSYFAQPSEPAPYVDTDTDTQAVGGFEIYRPDAKPKEL